MSKSHRLAALGMLGAGLLLPAAAHACDAASAVTVAPGPFSPNALKSAVAPYTSTFGGFNCTSTAVVLLLTGDYLSAKVTAPGGLKLSKSGVTDTISYELAADSGGANKIPVGVETFYINGTLLNLLGLLGSNGFDVPIYIKPSSTVGLPAGTYTGQFTVLWKWAFCKGIGVAGICIGLDQGSKSTVVTVNVEVKPVAPTVQMSTATTWDTENKGSNPKAIPGSRRRISVTVTNPDIAAMDTDGIQLTVATPTRLKVSLNGDGASTTFLTATEGSPASGLALTYLTSTSGSDDVEFSADGGTTWTLQPTAATEDLITAVKLKPRGAMAAKSSLTVSIPYEVK